MCLHLLAEIGVVPSLEEDADEATKKGGHE
jgi:hypothetical protein